MIKYAQHLKSKIFNIINKNPNAFNVKDDGWNNGIILFLNNIWDLKAMPSPEDTRWSNAYDDAVQHLVNNDDWSIEYTFLDRFKLLEKDEDFTKFLETVVHPDFRNDLPEIEFYVTLINAELSSIDITLAVSSYKEDLPIYSIRRVTKNDKIHILENFVPFVVDYHNEEYPYFHLQSGNWDDFGSKTTFYLTYYTGVKDYYSFGTVKITDGISEMTKLVIKTKFVTLDDSFCSVGQKEGYYKGIQAYFGINTGSILYALKDASYFTEINDKFASNPIFVNSLIRDDEVEQLSRNIRFILEGRSLENKYNFTYNFIPNYSDTSIEIELNYNNALEYSDRIFAVIGKNGAGKTQLITNLPLDISESKLSSFKPHKPIFSKVIAVSYSVFDTFDLPNQKVDFNYVFCGLLNKDKNLPSKTEKGQNLLEAYKKIKHHNRIEKWKHILFNFLGEDVLKDVFVNNSLRVPGDHNEFKIIEGKFLELIDKLSSGQGIMLEIMTKIIANIRYDSLILFDEPETHLHPNAISQLISSIYELVESFDSYCLITTHSPIIIQNIFGKNVYVMEKDNNIPFIRKIGVESFGENLTVLTEDVFSNSEINKHYKVMLDKMIEQYYNYETILEKIENDNLSLSLNAKIYIKSKLV
ncbi:MAG: AAA family ATPase [Flavobacteriaceae bacterium]|nr:AAA family ATPase [Flavobacteriaceae bacterium]